MTIDLNCDLGELPELIANGAQESMMQYITSANVACGGHAGDVLTMEETVRMALRSKIAIGAHPGYADRANFGRIELALPPEDIERMVFEQVCALAEVTSRLHAEVVHVKPHGALYNVAANNAGVAEAIAHGVARWGREVVLVGLAGTRMLEVWRAMGFAVAAEAFADRAYELDGTLRSRKLANALITDPAQAAEQALTIVQQGRAQTICIHSDTPGAVHVAAAVKKRLTEGGVRLSGLRH